jgi:hypothetical protein
MYRQVMIGIRCSLEFPFVLGLDSSLPHKPRHTMPPAPDTATVKLRMNTGAAVSFSALFVNGFDVSDKP